VRVALHRIDVVHRLLAAAQSLDEERIDERTFLGWLRDEGADVEVIAKRCITERSIQRHVGIVARAVTPTAHAGASEDRPVRKRFIRDATDPKRAVR
jgi:hypothetical protein